MATEIELHAPSASLSPTQVESMLLQADHLARTQVVPKQYRGRPEDIFAAAIMGAELGFGIFTSLRFVHVVDGRPEVSSEGKIALARSRGHSITGETSDTEATVVGTRGDTGDTMTVTYSMADAKQAGLAGRGVWKQHPKAMLWARAVSTLCRRLFPDVTLGSYAEGEISGADVYEPETVTVDADPIVYADPAVLELVRDLITDELTDGDRTTLAGWMRDNQLPSLRHDTIPAAAVEAVHNKVLDLLEDHDPPVTPADYTIEDSVPQGGLF